MAVVYPKNAPLQKTYVFTEVVEDVGGGALIASHVVSWLTTCPLLSTVLVTEAGTDAVCCTSDPPGVY